jgi:hypothetical protein
MGQKGPVLRPRCIGPGRARTQIQFNSRSLFLHRPANLGSTCIFSTAFCPECDVFKSVYVKVHEKLSNLHVAAKCRECWLWNRSGVTDLHVWNTSCQTVIRFLSMYFARTAVNSFVWVHLRILYIKYRQPMYLSRWAWRCSDNIWKCLYIGASFSTTGIVDVSQMIKKFYEAPGHRRCVNIILELKIRREAKISNGACKVPCL